MIKNNTYVVTVKRGEEVESVNIESFNASTAKVEAIEKFYFDGWYATGAILKVVH